MLDFYFQQYPLPCFSKPCQIHKNNYPSKGSSRDRVTNASLTVLSRIIKNVFLDRHASVSMLIETHLFRPSNFKIPFIEPRKVHGWPGIPAHGCNYSIAGTIATLEYNETAGISNKFSLGWLHRTKSDVACVIWER